MQAQAAILQRGKVVPNFALPSVRGGMLKRTDFRARRHLVLLVLPGVDRAAEAYLWQLRNVYPQIRAEVGAEVLAIIADPDRAVDDLRARIELPYPLLLDRERAVARRFLPADTPMGVFVIDHYGTLHAQWLLTQPDFPPTTELIAWLQVIEYQCVL